MHLFKFYVRLLGVTATLAASGLFFQAAAAQDKPASGTHATQTGKSLGAVETEYPGWFHNGFLDFREDLALANAAGKRLVILVTQDGCPYCNALVERNFAQRDIEALVRDKFMVVAINLVGDREVSNLDGKRYTEKSLAEALKIQFTPTLLFFNEKGETILRLNGYLPPRQFRVALDYLVEKNAQLTFRDYVELNAPPAQAGKLNAETFFVSPPYNLSRTTAANARPLAVFFEQKDCPNCDVLHHKILTDAETRGLIAQYDAVQLDMWDNTTTVTTPAGKLLTARAWARQLDVKYAPTIILFDGEGREIIRTEAFFKVFHTQSFFAYVLSGAYKQQPAFQRYISQRSEQLRAQGRDVDIWRMGDENPPRND